MKNYSLLVKLVVCALVICSTLGLSQSPSYGQGRSLTAQQLDAIVKPNLNQCSPQSARLKSGQLTSGRIDPASIIPTRNAREFPKDKITRTLHGMWRGEVHGDYNKDLRVDYFWIVDMQRNEGLIIAQRTGNQSMPRQPLPNAPKITYLMCANEGYVPSTEGGSQLHEFVKVSNSIEEAPRILQKATGLDLLELTARRKSQQQAQGQRVANPATKQEKEPPTLTDLWQTIVASGYFKSLPAVAFAGALFKPIRLELVPGEIGPAQVSLRWDGEYYGGGATLLKFAPGVPMRAVEYTQFVGTTATAGDFLVASPGNGKLYKVEAVNGGQSVSGAEGGYTVDGEDYSYYYDMAFDSVTLGPLQSEVSAAAPKAPQPKLRSRTRLNDDDVAARSVKKRK
jgi:hypothetical protein